ncbi:MAG: hypothetical protein IT456_26525 [Planctomycetes bacterium]|nr:hypothetical protein [Planctomycetota bacterium]
MAKKYPKQQRPQPSAISAQPVLPTTPVSSDQVRRIESLEGQVANMTEEQGAPSVQHSELPRSTLQESLQRVEGLLGSARSHYEQARTLDGAAKKVREEIDNSRRTLEQEFDSRKKKLEAEHKKRLDELVEREGACAKRETDVKGEEAKRIERVSNLAAQEWNAEQGFQVEKARILQPVQEEVAALRQQRDQLLREIKERQFACDAELAAQRESECAAFAQRLRVERDRADQSWQEELKSRRAELDARKAELEQREASVGERDRVLRGQERQIKMEQTILAEDQADCVQRVERLVQERTEGLRHELAAHQRMLEDARAQRDAHRRTIESRQEFDAQFAGCAPEQILAEIASLKQERDRLTEQLRERPDAKVAQQLDALLRERSDWLDERAGLVGEVARTKAELHERIAFAYQVDGFRKEKEALETTNALLGQALKELDGKVKELTRQDDNKNPMQELTRIDERADLQGEVRTVAPLGRATPSLRDFADDLRHRLAGGVPGRTLFYSSRDVRSFLGGLALPSRLLLLQGISGTGQTSLPLAFASAVGGDIEIVEVQAGWRDRQDLVGYYNAFHRHYYATPFLQALYRAGMPANRNRIFLMVLDEINLSRPEQFFADFLSALEQPMEKRKVTLVSDSVDAAPRLMRDGKCLPIPPNVWFVGTANHDESTTEFADKTYDRAHVMEMPRKTEDAQFTIVPRGTREAISYEGLEAAFGEAEKTHSAAVKAATHWLRSASFVQTLGQRFRVGWGNRLEHQIARYLPVVVEAGGSVGEAMDHLLVTKILRKLKDRHDVRPAALQELSEQILEAWSNLDNANAPDRSAGLIESEIKAKMGEEQE